MLWSKISLFLFLFLLFLSKRANPFTLLKECSRNLNEWPMNPIQAKFRTIIEHNLRNCFFSCFFVFQTQIKQCHNKGGRKQAHIHTSILFMKETNIKWRREYWAKTISTKISFFFFFFWCNLNVFCAT